MRVCMYVQPRTHIHRLTNMHTHQREAERASAYATEEVRASDAAKADRLRAEIALERAKMDCEAAERALESVQRERDAGVVRVEDLNLEVAKLSVQVGCLYSSCICIYTYIRTYVCINI